MVKKYFRNIIFSLIVTIAGGYSVHLLTKQDKPQEIKSQGNSGIVNNMKDNNGTINHNYYNTYPYVPPVLSVANKINNSYDLYVTLKMLTNFFKNNLEGELFIFLATLSTGGVEG